MALPALASLMGLGSGFAFGTGYGAGVRFGYEDVYPYLKGHMQAIQNMLQIPFASSGFKMASGVTAEQGKGMTLGLSPASDQPTAGMKYPDELNAVQGPAGQKLSVVVKGMRLNYYPQDITYMTPDDFQGEYHVVAPSSLGTRHFEFIRKGNLGRNPDGSKRIGFWKDRGPVSLK